jgi:hypothetical protein
MAATTTTMHTAIVRRNRARREVVALAGCMREITVHHGREMRRFRWVKLQ